MLAGARPPLITPLSWRDIVERSLLTTDTLADADITARKLGPAWLQRQERAMRWQHGALSRPIQEREALIKVCWSHSYLVLCLTFLLTFLLKIIAVAGRKPYE